MKALIALCSVTLAGSGLLGCGHARQALPSPRPPFTTTADAPFRSATPQPLQRQATRLPLPWVERLRLDNGMRVYVVSRPESNVVALIYGNGAAPSVQEGVPHGLSVLVGDALLQGTHMSDSDVVTVDLQIAGRTPQVITSPYGTTVQLQVLPSGVDQALFALGRIVRAPAFGQEGIETAKRQQVESLYDASDRLRSLAFPIAAKAAFGESQSISSSPRETATDLLKVTLDDVRRYYARAYTPANSVLVVAGPVTLSGVKDQIEKQFGRWSAPAAANPAPRQPTPREPALKRGVHALLNGGDESSIYIVQPGLHPDDPDSVALGLLLNTLTGAAESRLPHVLRHENALIYSIRSERISAPGGDLVVISTRVDSRVLGHTLRMIVAEITRLKELGMSERELAAAKSSLRAQMALDTTALSASAFAYRAMMGSPDDWYERTARAIDAATLSDLQRVARRCLRPARFPIVVAGQYDTMTRQLSSWGPIEYFTWN